MIKPFRYRFFLALLFFYLVPLIAIILFSLNKPSLETTWMMLCLGFASMAFGSVLLFIMITQWETETLKAVQSQQDELDNLIQVHNKKSETSLDQPLVLELQEQLKCLESELALKSQAFQEMSEKTMGLESQLENFALEQQDRKREYEGQLSHLMNRIKEFEQINQLQRDDLEKKQQELHTLENKIKDLNYEIKTLLHLTEDNSSKEMESNKENTNQSNEINFKVESWEQANHLLQDCYQIAQTLIPQNHYPRYQEFGFDTLAIDLRRLFDHLKKRREATIIVYSLTDRKIIFANSESKNLLGISSDKFILNFDELIKPHGQEWQNMLGKLSKEGQVKGQMHFTDHYGHVTSVQALFGTIPSEFFRNQAIGILFI